ncbi:MAG: polyprenol monophosphomannose synthase [Phycisphaerae bacterium]
MDLDVPHLVAANGAEISVTSEGFSVSGTWDGPPASIRWSEIGEIIGKKQDLFAIDRMWLVFRRVDPPDLLAISEENPGFLQVKSAMTEHFRHLRSHWYFHLMAPAFEENQFSIWQSDPDPFLALEAEDPKATSEKIATTVVVPTLNEALNLPALVERVFAALDPSCNEMIIVDDNSRDNTNEVIRDLKKKYPIECWVRTADRGLATAVIYGMDRARGRRIVVMDADLSHPPEKIPELVAALDDPQVNMAIGSRFVPGGEVDLHWPLHRRLNSLFGRMLARPLTSVRDMMSGFFAVRRDDLNLSALRPIGYKIALEMIVRHNWHNVVEIPITFSDRQAGQTKLSVAEQLRYLRHLSRLYPAAVRRRIFGAK